MTNTAEQYLVEELSRVAERALNTILQITRNRYGDVISHGNQPDQFAVELIPGKNSYISHAVAIYFPNMAAAVKYIGEFKSLATEFPGVWNFISEMFDVSEFTITHEQQTRTENSKVPI